MRIIFVPNFACLVAIGICLLFTLVQGIDLEPEMPATDGEVTFNAERPVDQNFDDLLKIRLTPQLTERLSTLERPDDPVHSIRYLNYRSPSLLQPRPDTGEEDLGIAYLLSFQVNNGSEYWHVKVLDTKRQKDASFEIQDMFGPLPQSIPLVDFTTGRLLID